MRRREPSEAELAAEYRADVALLHRLTLQTIWDFELRYKKPREMANQTRYIGQHPHAHCCTLPGTDTLGEVIWDPSTPWELKSIKAVIVRIADQEGREFVETLRIDRERDRDTLAAALRSLAESATSETKIPASGKDGRKGTTRKPPR